MIFSRNCAESFGIQEAELESKAALDETAQGMMEYAGGKVSGVVLEESVS